nr:hypothetical protein CparaKRNrm1_p075 [Cryptomonas paramecium]
MKYSISLNKNKHGIEFFRKIFYNIFFTLNFERIKKRNFLIVDLNYKKITKKKYLSPETLFIHKIYNIGMKMHFFTKNKKKINRNGFIDRILSIWAKLVMFYIFFKKNKNITNFFSLFIKFHTNCKHQTKRIFKFSFNFMTKIFRISFEESANEIKFIFNIDFVKTIFLQNLVLRNCWVISNFSFSCFLKYCKSYVFASYNSMTKCKKFLKHQIKYDFTDFKYDKHEYDFFHIKRNTIKYSLNVPIKNLEIFPNKYKLNEYYLKWKKKNVLESTFFYKNYSKARFKKNSYFYKILFY